MDIRRPVVAGQFYPASAGECRREVSQYLQHPAADVALPDHITAAVVPHAGWLFSGSVAGAVFAAIKQANRNVHTFIIFGAAHRYYGTAPALDDREQWTTPLGQIEIDQDLAQMIVAEGVAIADRGAHRDEHSIEVQVPFIQQLFPDAAIVPIVTPSNPDAVRLGDQIAKLIARQTEKDIVAVASTDLTHYGPRYGLTSAGPGKTGIDWARNVNDRRFIDLALNLDAHALLGAAIEDSSACGPGATAAAVTVARQLGVNSGILLEHTTSSDVMMAKFGESSSESVGYAGIVF